MAARRARPGFHLCPRHKIEYGALEQCAKCKHDPGPRPAERPLKLPAPPKDCLTAAQREAWFIKLANKALDDVDRLLKTLGLEPKRKASKKEPPAEPSEADLDGDWHVEVAIKAHRDTAIKAMRAAQELGAAREEAELVEARRQLNAKEAG
jgi:hypothetical protein